MRRRLELAQALVHEPQVLFLDEPTVGLDVATRMSIWEYVVKLKKKGVTIFITTHQMDEAERYCDRVGILKKGVLVKEGRPFDLTAGMRAVVTVRTDDGFPSHIPEGVDAVRYECGEAVFNVDRGADKLPQIIDAYADDGTKVFSWSVREPTLEDVYMQSVGTAEEGSFNDRQFRNIMGRR
jgi:ABC-2 type transport system ATP-binding protein